MCTNNLCFEYVQGDAIVLAMSSIGRGTMAEVASLCAKEFGRNHIRGFRWMVEIQVSFAGAPSEASVLTTIRKMARRQYLEPAQLPPDAHTGALSEESTHYQIAAKRFYLDFRDSEIVRFVEEKVRVGKSFMGIFVRRVL